MVQNSTPRRVLIASSHSLFGKGLQSLLTARWGEEITIVGLVSSVDEAIDALETLQPDMVILDYDDEALNRGQFLARFVEGDEEVRVVLLSLKEGKQGSEAVVYDRRTLAASEIDDWMDHGDGS